VEKIVESIPDASENEKLKLKEIPQCKSKFIFKEIEMSTLIEIVKDLKPKTVPDNINDKILINCFQEINTKLLDVINSCIREGSFPSCWKKSMVVPIEKLKIPKEPQDFRPINILPLCEKILEIVLHNQISKYVEENQILYELQSGFRQSHSCETAAQAVLSSWRKHADEGKVSIVAFLDFKRAFETIDRDRLIGKLKKYGFSESSLRLLKSFLCDRKQFTYVNREKSDDIDVNIGVPQGSVLGPLLFILYINDLPLHMQKVIIKIFADDTLISATADNYAAAAELLNKSLEILYIWLKESKVKLNVSKSKCMIISKSKKQSTKLKNEYVNFPIVIDGDKLELVESMKYLGVIIDENLKFDTHISYVLSKAGTKIGFLGRKGKSLSKRTKNLIYNSIVAPHFDYCASVMWSANEQQIEKLQVLQNQAMRIILNCKKSTPRTELLKRLNWLNIKQKLALNILVLVKKMINGEVPSYLSNEIHYVRGVHEHNTRTNENLYIPTVKSKMCEKSIMQSGFQLYNDLPTDIKNINETSSFKNMCKLYLMNELSVS
jgi:hypothetical protein